MTSITTGGKTYAGQYGSTDQSERVKLGDTSFHNGPLGLSATSTAGVDTGFNREPGGTLNSMTRGGKNHYYLTDALGSVVALADEAGTKVNTYAYSPRGVQRATTTEQGPQPYRFAGGYQDLSLDGIGNALGISGIVYAGLTEGQDAAEAATAAMIAEIGITGLCIAGEAAFTAVGAAAATPYCVVIGAAAATYVGATYQNDLS